MLIGLRLFIPFFPLNNSNKTHIIGCDLFFKTCFGSGVLLCGRFFFFFFFFFEEGTEMFSCCEIMVT